MTGSGRPTSNAQLESKFSILQAEFERIESRYKTEVERAEQRQMAIDKQEQARLKEIEEVTLRASDRMSISSAGTTSNTSGWKELEYKGSPTLDADGTYGDLDQFKEEDGMYTCPLQNVFDLNVKPHKVNIP